MSAHDSLQALSIDPEAILEDWCSSPCHFAKPTAKDSSAWHVQSSINATETDSEEDSDDETICAVEVQPPPKVVRTRTRAEVAQRSIEVLLAEYHKMVKESNGNSALPDAKPMTAATSAFLSMCPELPSSIDMRTVAKNATQISFQAAALVEKAPVLFIPAWLWLLRFFLRIGSPTLSILALLFGVGVLAAVACVVQQDAEQTAATVALHSRDLAAGSAKQPLVAGPSQSLHLCGALQPASILAPAAAAAEGLPSLRPLTPAAAPPASSPRAPAVRLPSSGTNTPTAGQLERLITDVQALHRQVYGKELTPARWNQEVIASAMAKMCKELGHDYKVEFCSTYDRMHAKMQELRQTVGM